MSNVCISCTSESNGENAGGNWHRPRLVAMLCNLYTLATQRSQIRLVVNARGSMGDSLSTPGSKYYQRKGIRNDFSVAMITWFSRHHETSNLKIEEKRTFKTIFIEINRHLFVVQQIPSTKQQKSRYTKDDAIFRLADPKFRIFW